MIYISIKSVNVVNAVKLRYLGLYKSRHEKFFVIQIPMHNNDRAPLHDFLVFTQAIIDYSLT